MLLKSLGKSRRNQVATVFMRKSIWIVKAAWKIRQIKQASRAGWSSERCGIHVSTSPSNESGENIFSDIVSDSADDASFEVLGAPYSILSVSLSASQDLYTRRGTLIGISGKVENTRSTLSIIEPFRRSLLRIPFLYEKISSTSPITVLISTKSPFTSSFTVLNLNGAVDWMVSRPSSLIAWTGHSLTISPTTNRNMGLSHLGNIKITGRGLIALAGRGNVYQISLRSGEEYLARPANIIAYTISQRRDQLPKLYNFSSQSFSRLQKIFTSDKSYEIEILKYFRLMQQTRAWKITAKIFLFLRKTISRVLWGESRNFLKFFGPAKILISSRAVSVSEIVMSRHEKNETDNAKLHTISRDESTPKKNENPVLNR